MTPAERVAVWVGAFPLWQRAVAWLSSAPQATYLVGGSVRDALLGHASDDLDVAIEGEVYPLARALADALGGAFVGLDAERQVARVVVRVGAKAYHIDLAGLRAEDIRGDLLARDFTLNAMAVPLPLTGDTLLDPAGGLTDLTDRVLKAVYLRAMEDDPLRVLRGVRLAGAIALIWTADTLALARAAAPALSGVSGERLRDELFNILALPRSAAALRSVAAIGAMDALVPARDAVLTERALDRLEQVESALTEGANSSVRALASEHRAYLEGYWGATLSEGRTRGELLKLALLLAAVPMDRVRSSAERLKVSRREVAHIDAVVRAAETLADGGVSAATPLDVHRYYRAYGEAGVNGAVAGVLGGAPMEVVTAAARLLDAWFEEFSTVVQPPPLLSGEDVMRLRGFDPGRHVGEALDALREAQVAGEVRDVAQARAFLLARA